MLILSLFPGADLFGMAFERHGFTVVKGPDVLLGGDIRNFKGIKGKFDGIIGGPPCKSFSVAIQSQPGGSSDALEGNLIPEFERVVNECSPLFYIMENVPQAPKPNIPMHPCIWDEICDAHEFGASQHRKRRFSSNLDLTKELAKFKLVENLRHQDPWPCITATEYKASAGSNQRVMRQRAARKVGRKLTLKEMNEAMGLPATFTTPCLTQAYQYSVVGNGVPLEMGEALAKAIKEKYAAKNII